MIVLGPPLMTIKESMLSDVGAPVTDQSVFKHPQLAKARSPNYAALSEITIQPTQESWKVLY